MNKQKLPWDNGDTAVARIRELQAMPYAKYLRTPEWQERRRAAIQMAWGKCQLNSKHGEGLHVHHRTYERRGCELPSDLIVLCAKCHASHHEKLPANSNALLDRALFLGACWGYQLAHVDIQSGAVDPEDETSWRERIESFGPKLTRFVRTCWDQRRSGSDGEE